MSGNPGKVRAPRFDGCRPSSDQASRTAKAIKRTDTKAEVVLRRALWARGLRYRKYVATLPGHPDIVFKSRRVVVFCDGDFWHGRNWEDRKRKLKGGSNAPYWLAKIEANMLRDRRHTEALHAAGYTVVRLWETDILGDPQAAVAAVMTALRR